MGKGRAWGPEEDARLIALLAQGATHDAIAADLGRVRSSIGSRLYLLGLRRNKRSHPAAALDTAQFNARQGRCIRPCLCCRKEFPSAGPGNRLCGICRTKTTSPYAP